MALPIDAPSLDPLAVSDPVHVAWHEEMRQLAELAGLSLPARTTTSTGHLGDHEAIRAQLEMALAFNPAENAADHLPDHHRLLHLYLTRGPQSITQPAGSSTVTAGSDPTSVITAAGDNGTVWFAAGTHRVAGYANLRPRTGQTWVAAQGAVITGAVVISGPWTVSGATWWATGQLPASANTTGVCQGGGSDCQPCEDVYRDGAHLTRVMSQAAVGPGKYWNDYATNRIYVGDDPAGHVIEQAKKATFIHANDAVNPGVTLRNLTVQQFACPYQSAAITVGNNPNGTGWLVEQCLVKLNHADGVKTFGDSTTVRRCIITQNGAVGGPSGYQAANLVAEGNEVSANNNNNFDTGWEAGGAKPVHLDDPIYRGNVFKDNIGTGLWFDIDTRRALVRWNSAVRNQTGLYYEISFDGTFDDNYAADNTTEQLFWNASARGYVRRNRIVVPAGGTAGYGLRFAADPARDTSDPSDYEPHTLAGVSCVDNDVTHRSAALYAASIYLFNTVDSSYFNAVSFDRNTYRLGYRGDTAFWRNAAETFTAWQAAGKDVNGTRVGPLALNTAEGGSNGTTVTTGNSGGNSGLAFDGLAVPAGGTLAFDSTRAYRGVLSYKLAQGGTAGALRFTWSTGIGTLSVPFWTRFFMYWTALPATGPRLLNFLNTGGANLTAGLNLTTGGLLQALNAASAGVAQTTVPVAVNQWVRVEMKVVPSATVGEVEVRLYNTPAAAAPTEAVAATGLALAANCDFYRIGSNLSAASIGPFWIDEWAISTEDWIGP